MSDQKGGCPDSFRTVSSPALRLNKYIASCGICSRRDADRLILSGRVTVNGERPEAGTKVFPGDQVAVDGRIIHPLEHRSVVAWYKPAGVTCTERDAHAGVTIREAFTYPERLTYAGRLDRDSEGLLLMTNDGDLIEAMMRGRGGHEKEYIVRVRNHITDAELHRLSKGIWLKELKVTTRPCRVERLGNYTFRIVLTQGLNRQIRRMCTAVGHEVKFLKRVRVLTVRLGQLKPGEYRVLSPDEMVELYRSAGMKR